MKKGIYAVLAVLIVSAMVLSSCDTGSSSGGKGYTVTFDKNGGSTNANPKSKRVTKSGGNIGALPLEPTKAGYVFIEWNTQADGSGDAFTATTPVTASITVYAQWEQVPEGQFVVTFNKNGGTKEATPRTKAGGAAGVGVLPTPPTKPGYIFSNWNTKADDSGALFNATTAVTENITVYAQWDQAPEGRFVVIFDKNGGDTEAMPPQKAGGESGVVLPGINPTKAGYIFDSWNTKPDGSGAEFIRTTPVTADITVYAQWKKGFIITFNNNSQEATSPVPSFKQVLPPAVTIDALPTQPALDFCRFKEWNTKADGTGEPFTTETVITDSITVYANWEFLGGTPKIEGQTIVHEMPLFTAANGSVVNGNGTYKIGRGSALDYLFPTSVGDPPQSAADYDYFIVLTSIQSGQSGNGTGVAIRQYGTATLYNSPGNMQPWLSNADGKKLLLDVKGGGDNNGFRIQAQGDASGVDELKIESITFYKAPRYTVTFVYGYNNLTADVSDVWGSDENHKGYGVGSAWPEDPDRKNEPTPMYFLGWKDAAGNTVTATTPISANTTLTANWTDTEPQGWMELINNASTCAPLYGFTIPSGGTLGDYDRVSFKLKASGSTVSGRLRAWGTFPTSIYTESSFPVTQSTAADMRNAVGGLLLTTSSSGVSGSISLAVSDGWVLYTLDLKGGRDATYGSDSNITYKWDDNATGIILLAFGIIPTAGGSGDKTYFIKDIVLTNADKSKSVEALKPNDPSLWNGAGQSAFVKQTTSGPVTRKIMYYEEG